MIFTPAARRDMVDAQDWYEREAVGLGRRFRVAVDIVVERMSTNPYLFRGVYNDVRRALLRGFPYALLFVIEADKTLTVIACFHGSRDPSRWEGRRENL